MKVLNLYSGIGGNRKLWEDVEVTAVEYNLDIAKVYKSFFPKDKVIVTDAHEYLLKHFKEFDFIWSSPPCPSHSVCNHFLKGQGIFRYPDMNLYQEILFLKHFFKGKYCVENVKPYYQPLIESQYIGRHAFWTNFKIRNIKVDIQIGTFNRNASKKVQRKTMAREVQVPQYLNILDLKNFKIKNKRQVLRNCVLPKIGLHILNESKTEEQAKLF